MRQPLYPLPLLPLLTFLPVRLLVSSTLLVASQFAALAPAAASDGDLRLVCGFSKFRNTGYTEEFARTWIAETQTHIFEGDTVTFNSADISFHRNPGKVSKRNTKRIEWSYEGHVNTVKQKDVIYKQTFTYFFTTNKVATKVKFPHFKDIEHVWGTCEQRPVARKKAKPASGNPARDNSLATSSSGKVRYWQSHQPASVTIIPVDKSDWVELRHGAETRLFIQRHINAVIIESRTPEFARLHDRIINGEVTALGVATRATEDHQDLQKSKYRHGRIGYFGASHEGDIRRIFLMGQQIDNLRYQNERFLELSLSDLDSDVWWVDRLSQ
jgi:hypothetical protein